MGQKSRRRKMKQKTINMIGCSKSCQNCGSKCPHECQNCGSKCSHKCPHKCPRNCYLNRRIKGGSGCGSACPVGGLTKGGSLTKALYTTYNPPGGAYKPWEDPSWQAIENTGYPNIVGGYTYSKSRTKSKSKSKNKAKSVKINSKTFKNKHSGGGLIPTDINNLFSGIKYNFQSAANAINGYKAPVDPTVYKDQLVSKPYI